MFKISKFQNGRGKRPFSKMAQECQSGTHISDLDSAPQNLLETNSKKITRYKKTRFR